MIEWNKPVNVDYLDDQLISDLLSRKNIEAEEATEEDYKQFNSYSARKCLSEFLAWNGIHGYTDEIIRILDSIDYSQGMVENEQVGKIQENLG